MTRIDAEVQAEDFSGARPLLAEIDLDAITNNVGLIRERAGPATKLIIPIKANGYGHGVVEVARHLASLGVDGLATANVENALAVRRSGEDIRILVYGAQLPEGNKVLIANNLTPTVYDDAGADAVAKIGERLGRRLAVHLKVDAGLGRLGVRLDAAVPLARRIADDPHLHLEGVYTHIPFGHPSDAEWSKRRLNAFAGTVREIETEIGYPIEFSQAAASSVMTSQFPDPLNTVSPGHLTFGLSPIAGTASAEFGFRPALKAIRARVIHLGGHRAGDDLAGGDPPDRLPISTAVILYGMDNGYRPAAKGHTATMLCGGQRCPVLGVSAEYSIIDVSACNGVKIGDTVTIVGQDGNDQISPEEIASDLGAPSAAYWLVALKNVPYRYSGAKV